MERLIPLSLAFISIAALTAHAQPQPNTGNPANGELWGMTYGGGTDGVGVIFKAAGDGTGLTVVHDFQTDFPGRGPSDGLTPGTDGKLYGMAGYGGVHGKGVIYAYDPSDGTYIRKWDFDGADGMTPVGKLVAAANGKLYGMTSRGGTSTFGVIFEYDPVSSVVVKKFDFLIGIGDGHSPRNGLVVGADGKLYGMTGEGGTGFGVLFDYDPTTNIYTKRFDFTGATTGSDPWGTLCLATNDKLYGMTHAGGANGMGVLFEFDPATNTYTKHLDFAGASNGASPEGSLMQALNGKLFGTTTLGGASSSGVLFEFDPTSNSYVVRAEFGGGATTSSGPTGQLIETIDGTFYGCTRAGGSGAGGVGTIFEYNRFLVALTKKHDFTQAEGRAPAGNLVKAANGKLYGVTSAGGSSNVGVLFEYNVATTAFVKKIDFEKITNGGQPVGNLTRADNGKFYGLTPGKFDGGGALFEFDPDGDIYTKKVDFDGTTNSTFPYASLTLATNGKLYATTAFGGLNGEGALFEFDPATGDYAEKFHFGGTSGSEPRGTLLAASNGKLYGTTQGGGTSAVGTLFEYDPVTNMFTKKLDFGGSKGQTPQNNLVQAANGKLYGTTNDGFLYEWDPGTGDYAKRHTFQQSTGTEPGNLILASNGKIYGLCQQGGANGSFGVIFEYDPATHVYTKTFDFLGSAQQLPLSGGFPGGGLLEAGNGRLYGMNQTGGANSLGVLFEYDIVSGSVSNKLDFNGHNGGVPLEGSLVFTKSPQIITFPALVTHAYGDEFEFGASSSSNLPITYSSADPTVVTITGSTARILKPGTTTITASQPGDASSLPANDVQRPLEATKAQLTVAVNASRTYYEANPQFILSYTGFQGTDQADDVDVPPVPSTLAVLGSNAGAYAITYLGGSDDNYELVTGPSELTINKAALSAQADNKLKQYGDANPALTLTLEGFKGSDDESVIAELPTISTTASQYSNSGDHDISITGGSDENYSFTLVGSKMTIGKAPLQATASNATKVYGDANPPFTINWMGFKGPDSESVLDQLPVPSTAAVQYSNAGDYDISLTGGSDENYSITPVGGTLTIGKAALQATASAQKIFGDANPSLSITWTGFKGPDDEGDIDQLPILSTTASQFSNAGVYDISLAGGVDANYSISPVTGTLTIAKAPLAALATNKRKVYGAVVPVLPISYTGFKGADTAADIDSPPVAAAPVAPLTNAGIYPISLTGGSDNNYAIALIAGTLIVDKAQLLFLVDVKHRLYAVFPNPELTMRITGFVGGDDISMIDQLPSLSTTAVAESLPGDYPVTLSGGFDNNYFFTFDNSILTVNKLGQTISFTAIPNRPVSDGTFSLVATSTSGLPVTFASSSNKISISGSVVTMIAAGTAAISAAQTGNSIYDPAENVVKQFCINPATPTVTVTGLNTVSVTLTSSATSGNQWFRNNAPIVAATSSTLAVTLEGVFKVQVTIGGCVSAFSSDQNLILTGAISESQSNVVEVFPNPASGWLQVQLGDLQGTKEVKIYSVNGTPMAGTSVTGNLAAFDVSEYAVGVYVVRVLAERTVKSIRFVRY